MSGFVASPKPKRPKIPAVLMGDLMDALALYLPTVVPYRHAIADFYGERSLGPATVMAFYGDMDASLGRRVKIEGHLLGRAAMSTATRLFPDPFIVQLESKDLGWKQDVVIDPRADRSIGIFPVLRWENGAAVYQRTGPSE